MKATTSFREWVIRLAFGGAVAIQGAGCADQGSQMDVTCNSVNNYGPVLRVVDDASGQPICSVTFAVVQSSTMDAGAPIDPGATQCSSGHFQGCPPADAGEAACAFLLSGLSGLGPSTPTYSVQVSAPGYAPAVVNDIHGGYGGCFGSGPNTDSVVRLTRTAP